MFSLGISDFRGLLLESSFASELYSDQVEKHLQRIYKSSDMVRALLKNSGNIILKNSHTPSASVQ